MVKGQYKTYYPVVSFDLRHNWLIINVKQIMSIYNTTIFSMMYILMYILCYKLEKTLVLHIARPPFPFVLVRKGSGTLDVCILTL